MSAPVSADVESLCSKCGDVWHVVVAKVGDHIARVQCKQCGKVHRHRPPGGPPPKTAAARKTATGTSRAAREAKAAAPSGPLVQADLSRPVRTYRPAEIYQPGDRIQHASFGTGVVERSPGPGKMEVCFPDTRRILAQGKAASTLERPPPRAPEGE